MLEWSLEGWGVGAGEFSRERRKGVSSLQEGVQASCLAWWGVAIEGRGPDRHQQDTAG